MQKSKILKTRKGFTLVEVALAVAVGLIIIGGAVLGYNAVKDNASNSNARNRVLSAVTMIEEYSAANGGSYPASVADVAEASTGAFSTMWSAKRPDDKASSPWGGPTGDTDGVNELGPLEFGNTTAPAAAVAALNAGGVAAPGEAANMLYVTPATASNNWGAVTAYSTSALVTFKNYAVGIYDKGGNPWWDAKGGK